MVCPTLSFGKSHILVNVLSFLFRAIRTILALGFIVVLTLTKQDIYLGLLASTPSIIEGLIMTLFKYHSFLTSANFFPWQYPFFLKFWKTFQNLSEITGKWTQSVGNCPPVRVNDSLHPKIPSYKVSMWWFLSKTRTRYSVTAVTAFSNCPQEELYTFLFQRTFEDICYIFQG